MAKKETRKKTATAEKPEQTKKTLMNTTASQAEANVSDLRVWGSGDAFKLILKAHSEDEGWMKLTKAMEIPNVGCVVQTTTQQGDNITEALTFVPGVHIEEIKNKAGLVVARKLTSRF